MPGAILDYFHKKRSVANLEVSIPEEGIELKAFLHNIEKDFYQEALALCNGNKEKAARMLGINPPAFRKALRERFNLDSEEQGGAS